MSKRTRMVIGGVVAAAVIGATGLTVAQATSDDSESPITGEALDKATTAALAHTGGGRVTETEVGDEDSMYEVEVTLEDGRRVDVQLDEDFAVVGAEADDENEVGDDD